MDGKSYEAKACACVRKNKSFFWRLWGSYTDVDEVAELFFKAGQCYKLSGEPIKAVENYLKAFKLIGQDDGYGFLVNMDAGTKIKYGDELLKLLEKIKLTNSIYYNGI